MLDLRQKGLTLILVVLCSSAIALRAFADDAETPAVDKEAPESVEDLLAIEERVTAMVEHATDTTVGLRIRNSYGSGVVVSADGYILTAGHVSGEPGRRVRISFADGTRADGTTLGRNPTMDAGLIKIDGTQVYPTSQAQAEAPPAEDASASEADDAIDTATEPAEREPEAQVQEQEPALAASF